MIRRIRGKLTGLLGESALIETGGLTYEVYLPLHVRERLEGEPPGSEVELCTYYYLHTDPARSTPVLLGFETEIQREFFEMLMEVPRMGPRAALRAFALPVPTLAKAVELQDTRMLKTLPGVGPQKVKDIIATLAGKLGRFVDAQELERAGEPAERALQEFEGDALDMLTQLGMSRGDAVQAIRQVRKADPEVTSPDEIVRRVFRNR